MGILTTSLGDAMTIDLSALNSVKIWLSSTDQKRWNWSASS